MDVIRLPFNQLLGLEVPPPDSGFLVSLPAGPQHANHLGTVHAGALLAVAEAGSGAYLVRHLGSGAGFVPVVRRLEAKFRKPSSGRVSARASVSPEEVARWSAELAARGRVSASVPVEVVDAAGVVLSATVEWFIARGRQDAGGQDGGQGRVQVGGPWVTAGFADSIPQGATPSRPT
jgi:acyl-coenzyme A thioesterase PaaI-like protein